MKLKISIIAILVYLFSVCFNYWFVHISYSKGGTRSQANIKSYVTWSVFCPIINTAIVFYFIADYPPWKEVEKEDNYNNLFNVKKT